MQHSNSETKLDLNNVPAVVLGGGTGIGALIAEALARWGAPVALLGRRPAPLQDHRDHLRAQGARCIAIPTDARDQEALERAWTEIEAHQGRPRVLVNCAGVLGPIETLDRADPETWLQAAEGNIRCTFLSLHLALRSFSRSQPSWIVNISSAAANSPPVAAISAYAVSKAVIDRLTQMAAHEVAGSSITVCALHPTPIATDMMAEMLAHSDEDHPTTQQLHTWAQSVLDAETDGRQSLLTQLQRILATPRRWNGQIIDC